MKLAGTIICCALLTGGLPPGEVRLEGAAQGTTWHVSYTDSAQRNFWYGVDSLLADIDRCLSIYRTDSEVSAFNQFDDFRFQSGHFYPVLQRSAEIYRATHGAFDPTVMPLTEAYRNGKKTGKPWLHEIDSLLQYVGFPYITFTRETIHKTKPGVRLDFDGIAQGYTVDVIARWLETKGIDAYTVEVGGELRCRGSKTVDIEDPLHPDKTLLRLALRNQAIATAGNYRNFYTVNGQMYRHVIHPKTGLARPDSLLSVTVVAPDAITADGFDTPMLAMGFEESKQLLQRQPDLDACLVYRKTDGSTGVYLTPRLKAAVRPL